VFSITFAGKSILLVLDNFEQILPRAGRRSDSRGERGAEGHRVESRAAPHRRRARVSIPPLDLPNPEHLPSLEVLTQSDAVRLFIERAMAVRPDSA